jgi:hypothetical protein
MSTLGRAVVRTALSLLAAAGSMVQVPAATDDGPPATVNRPRPLHEAIAELQPRRGLLDLYLDPDLGKVWLRVPPPSGPRGEAGRYLYVEGLSRGVGSNPIGLDRGQLGPARIIVLRAVGGRVLVEQPNLAYRALSDEPLERAAVEESFASSVLWAGPIAARDDAGATLVDFTSFVVRDAHEVAATLRERGEGEFALDRERSAVDLEACLAFSENVELEAVLTFAGKAPGPQLRAVAPNPSAVTVVQHHSILRLPDPGYRPRSFDPRAGSFAVRFQDYAAGLDQPLARRWIVRHRLEKRNPGAARSPATEPLIYYVDPAAPEPLRSALVEGASWWAEAFEAAGFVDAFRVELLPEGAHPLDARFNVIQWVHRATRGWSYGGGVVDPRTGEMVKAHVSLGSLRVRQDLLLFEGLLGTERTGSGAVDDPIQLALARIRQLAAHEVGHTLGLAHNFAASTYLGRASVMDYPAPRIVIDAGGALDASAAYGVGVGAWDRHAVRYAYTQFPADADEARELGRIVGEGLERGLLFLTDADARPPGAAEPLANLWDNGDDPVAELEHVMRVRQIALGNFGQHNIAMGQPVALLQEVLVPLYFHHRYQLTATAKMIGGLHYRHALRGDGPAAAQPVSAARQRSALGAMLDALSPAGLDLPDSVLALLLPRPPGYTANRELFRGASAPAFDGLGAAATAAQLVVSELLQPERCARVVDFHRRDADLPGLDEILATLVERAFETPQSEPERQRAIRRAVQQTVVAGLIGLSSDARVSAAVRAAVDGALDELQLRLQAGAAATAQSHQDRYLHDAIRRYLERPYPAAALRSVAPGVPPGSPIGVELDERFGECSQGSI